MSLLPEPAIPGAVQPGPSMITGGRSQQVGPSSSAAFVVVEEDPTLIAERTLVVGANLTLGDGGPGGNLTLAVDGVTQEADALDFPGQSGSLGAATIATAPGTGEYLLIVTGKITTAAGAGTISAEATYQDGGAQTATALTGVLLTGTGYFQGQVAFRHVGGGDITVQTTLTGLVGPVAYDVYFRVVRLG